MNILEIKSLRIKNTHFTIEASESPQERAKLTPVLFPSINKAKAYSRKIGGAKAVRAFKSKDEAYDFLRAWEIFAMAAAAKEKING